MPRRGTSGGAVLVDAFAGDRAASAWLWAEKDAQRMAVLPAASVVRALLRAPADVAGAGAVTADELLGGDELRESDPRGLPGSPQIRSAASGPGAGPPAGSCL